MRAALIGLAALAFVGCSNAPGPSDGPQQTGTAPAESGEPDPSDPIVGQLMGPWRRSPVILDDSHIAIISDACALVARERLGGVEADLPTAVVDARGEGLATAILADDLTAIECLVKLDDTASTATVQSIDRLSGAATTAVDGTKISIASLVVADDRPGGRTIAFGRVGPDAEAAKVGFDDATVVLATSATGWWAMWWQGTVKPASVAATDTRDIVVGNTKAPVGQLEARVGPSEWWVDQDEPAPGPASTVIHAMLVEKACASGASPEGRIDPPTIVADDQRIVVTYWVRLRPGAQDCQGNSPFALELKLPEPLGSRVLYDGSESPPRDVMKGPPG